MRTLILKKSTYTMIVKIRFLCRYVGVTTFYILQVAVVTTTTCMTSFSEAKSPIKVHWDLMTNPVVFGENATLTCMVKNNGFPCERSNNRIWEGGPSNSVLLINGHSTDKTKYEELFKDPCKNFSLVIKSFDVSDVNCSYRCSYGLESSRKELSLDQQVFIAKPQHNMTKVRMKTYESDIEINVEFKKVYPFPNCSMLIGVHQIDKDFVIANVSQTSMFYDITLHRRIPIPYSCNVCGWNTSVTLVCSLNSKPVVKFTYTLNCTVNWSAPLTRRCFDSVTQETMYSIICSVLGIAIGFMLITLTLVFYRWLKKTLESILEMLSKHKSNSSLEDDIDGVNEMTEFKLKAQRKEACSTVYHPTQTLYFD